MFNLKKLTGFLGDSANKFSGNTDFLEGACALCALVAAADGSVDDDEIVSAIAAVKANKTISDSFSTSQIESTMDTMLTRVSTRTGRISLWDELKDIGADGELGQVVVACGVEVADADGDVDDAEMKVLKKAGSMFGVNVEELLEI
jgi:tellurite resistance protein TerB